MNHGLAVKYSCCSYYTILHFFQWRCRLLELSASARNARDMCQLEPGMTHLSANIMLPIAGIPTVVKTLVSDSTKIKLCERVRFPPLMWRGSWGINHVALIWRTAVYNWQRSSELQFATKSFTENFVKFRNLSCFNGTCLNAMSPYKCIAAVFIFWTFPHSTTVVVHPVPGVTLRNVTVI